MLARLVAMIFWRARHQTAMEIQQPVRLTDRYSTRC
jgi:hypothetical protein